MASSLNLEIVKLCMFTISQIYLVIISMSIWSEYAIYVIPFDVIWIIELI